MSGIPDKLGQLTLGKHECFGFIGFHIPLAVFHRYPRCDAGINECLQFSGGQTAFVLQYSREQVIVKSVESYQTVCQFY